MYIYIYIHRTNWLWTGVDLVYNWWLGCNQPIQGMWWDIAGEERWQGQFTPIKCIWVKVGIRKIQWSPTNDDRPWTSTTHMASLTSQRGAQCRINGKPAWNLVPHSGFFFVLMSQMFIDPYAVFFLRGYPCDEKNLRDLRPRSNFT